MSDAWCESGPSWLRWVGLGLGPAAALAVYLLIPAEQSDSSGQVVAGLSHGGRCVAAIGVLMAVWWLSEALPLEATALLPLVLFPVLGVTGIREATASYANEVIYLFMGGLILGLGMERWGLHRRVALFTLRLCGTSPAMVVGGMMLATAFISMWVSNTATAVMMLPIGMGVVRMVEERRERPPPASLRSATSPVESDGGGAFGKCLLLGIAYAASIGGVGTLIGTPPNAVMMGFANDTAAIKPAMSFGLWLKIGVPVVCIFLPLSWLYLTRVAYRLPRGKIEGLAEAIRDQWRGLGRLSRGEWAVLGVFLGAVVLWVFRTLLVERFDLRWTPARAGAKPVEMLTDTGIAIGAALALFLIPVGKQRPPPASPPAADRPPPPSRATGEGQVVFAMDWATASKLPFGVLLLFGGGLCLSDAFSVNRVDVFLGDALGGVGALPVWLVVMLLTAAIVFITEIASNTAVAAAFMPVAFTLAGRLGVHPHVLMVPVAVGASYAFMMPMGTPPNAMVFATGRVTMRQMAAAGFGLNLLSIVVITAAACWVVPMLVGG